ncbi:hypothetical protein SAMN04489761_4276 [Tenacibaculum sp. MAR_2009_124]|uniref:hypothetical protein n=1 Tax=Tenacibaculum sp. MAR_2009_124 TaxID=1250059 RepID=UPI00089886C2|nr:hypothetical protein [Tenacibaculum sp. MAR_2009_124]SED10110.1 hypothetical protein SAMN04489761_4276 [Tenacibaculum sp. MAR_2009_124]
MAGVTTTLLGAASAAYSIVSGEQQKAEAKEAIANLEVPELNNPYEDVRVSTVGSDLIKEEGQRRTANILNSLQGSGARNMLSAVPKIVSMNNQINKEAMRDIDSQMMKREYAIASYEEKKNRFEENRYQNELSGYGQMYDVGQHSVWNGIKTGITSLGSLGRQVNFGGGASNGFESGMFGGTSSGGFSSELPPLSF